MTLVVITLILLVVAGAVFAAVNYGGLKMTKETLETEEPQLADDLDQDDLDPLPTDVQF